MNQNAPVTLGAAMGLLPSSVAAVVVAFAGADWSSGQIAAVLGLAGVLGSILGAVGGKYIQGNLTDPKPDV